RRAEDELDLARVAARLVDRLVQVELARRPRARELAQAAERDPHLPAVERPVGAVVGEAALLGDLHRRARTRLPADPDAGRVGAVIAVGGAPAGADPPVTAVVALGLLAERLEEPAQELVRGEPLELGELLGRELRKILGLTQPVEQSIGHLVAELPLDALEDAREDPV